MSPICAGASATLLVKEASAFSFRSLTNTMCLCQGLFIALASRLELDLDQLQLILEDAEQSAAESDAAKDATEPPERRRRAEVANRNRGALPAHLPRYEVVIEG